jgi:hypothetical protein
VWACDDQPALTVWVQYGPDRKDHYTLTGYARKHETVRVPLTTSSLDWLLTGNRAALPAGAIIEADVLDGDGYRLEASIDFRLDRLPASPRIVVGDGASGPEEVVTPSGFMSRTRCESW